MLRGSSDIIVISFSEMMAMLDMGQPGSVWSFKHGFIHYETDAAELVFGWPYFVAKSCTVIESPVKS